MFKTVLASYLEKTHILTMLYRSHLTIFSIDNQHEKGSKQNAMEWSTTAYFPLFPEGVLYDPENHRYLTKKVNSYFGLINTISRNYRENKKGINQSDTDLSPFVARPGFEPGTSGL
jgi:hypothetical protein